MTIGFGGYNGFPVFLGGGTSDHYIEHHALLRAGRNFLDTSSTTGFFQETYGEAGMLASGWRINRRLSNQAVPTRMMENLPVWEAVARTIPTPDQFDQERRNNLAAKLRGIANNAFPDIQAAVMAVLGNNFVTLHVVNPVNAIVYWPGVNPGPPGLEWSSNRARVSVQMSNAGLSTEEFLRKRDTVVKVLDDMLPAWMTFCVGTDSAIIVNQGIVGQTIL